MSTQQLILEVSNSYGCILTLEYINVLRGIFKDQPMTKSEYESGVAECNRLGRQRVIAMHQAAAWNAMTTPRP